MRIRKAVITAAGKGQRSLPLQTLIDRDGAEKPVLRILIEEVLRAGAEEIGLVVRPEDEAPYLQEAGEYAGRLSFIHQRKPKGYGDAISLARNFTAGEPFLHLVGDHLYVSRDGQGCAAHLVATAEREACAVSAVQATRESLLPYYGVVGGQRVRGKSGLYRVERVMEKPTPTVAERHLIVSGLRAGHYLCFFGMHVLTPAVFDILEEQFESAGDEKSISLAAALDTLASREQILALEMHDARYDIGVRYGLMTAQIALALNGRDKGEVLSRLLDLLAKRELSAGSQGGT